MFRLIGDVIEFEGIPVGRLESAVASATDMANARAALDSLDMVPRAMADQLQKELDAANEDSERAEAEAEEMKEQAEERARTADQVAAHLTLAAGALRSLVTKEEAEA